MSVQETEQKISRKKSILNNPPPNHARCSNSFTSLAHSFPCFNLLKLLPSLRKTWMSWSISFCSWFSEFYSRNTWESSFPRGGIIRTRNSKWKRGVLFNKTYWKGGKNKHIAVLFDSSPQRNLTTWSQIHFSSVFFCIIQRESHLVDLIAVVFTTEAALAAFIIALRSLHSS